MRRQNIIIAAFLTLCPAVLSGQDVHLDKVDTTIVAPAGFRFAETLPFSMQKTSVLQVYKASDLDFSPSIDYRSSFSNIPGGSVTESGASGRNNLAAFLGSSTYMIDGMLLSTAAEHLSIDEIESVTTVGGIVDRFKLGMGNGFYIKTSMGGKEGHHVRAGVESGFAFAGRTASWCNGAEFAEMMNRSRAAAGLPAMFTPEQIAGFAKGDAYDRVYHCVDMLGMTVRDWRSSQKASFSMNGKQGKTAYYTNVNYGREGDIFKIGPASDFNTLNARGNICTNFSRSLSIDIRSALSLDIRRMPVAGFNPLAASNSPVDFPLTLKQTDEDGFVMYGVSTLVPDNYYAALLESGANTTKDRFASLKATVNYDFASIVPGLKSESFVGFQNLGSTTDGTTGDYLACYYEPSTGEWVQSSKHQGIKSSARTVKSSSYVQNIVLRETLKYDLRRGVHDFAAQAWAQMSDSQINGTRVRGAAFSASADYSYREKYILQAVFYVPGSQYYPYGQRFSAGGAGGFAWVLSNEGWLKGVKWIDHLKIMAQGGVAPLDVVTSQYQFLDSYAKKGSYTSGVSAVESGWLAGQATSVSKSGTVISRLGNKSLDRGHQTEANVGLEGSFFSGRLNLTANVFYLHNKGLLTNGNSLLPDFYGMSGMVNYINWNSTLQHISTFGAGWSDRLGDVHYELSWWCSRNTVLRDRYLETVINDYSKVEGTYSSCILGYEYIGRFSSQDEIDNSPRQTMSSVTRVGDLKYKDMDGNGVIDSNDITVIEDNASGWFHNMRIVFGMKNFDLMMLFRARTGSTVNLAGCGYYTGGRGYVNYTGWMKDNAGGDYPSLAYEGSEGNFQTSGFWFRDGDFLKLRNLEIGYSVPGKALRIFLRGENLFSLDHIGDLDPEYISAGYSTYAINRTLSVGINLGLK